MLKPTSITETSSFFIEDTALFGAWPTQDHIDKLEKWGVDFIINLTMKNESKLVPYKTSRRVIEFPIPDRSVPPDRIKFSRFIVFLSKLLAMKKKLYIHCKGGHGRAGLVVSTLLCYTLSCLPKTALDLTKEFHNNRSVMNPYWRIVGSPQTYDQKSYVFSLFKEHNIGVSSPFYHLNPDSNEPHINVFLLQTYLGKITGKNADKFLRRKWKLLNIWEE